jgi:ABC-type transport system substrate-binding protein
MDTEKRQALYAKAQQIVLDELPILPLWYNSHITVMNSRVQGFVPMITGSYYPLLSVKLEK